MIDENSEVLAYFGFGPVRLYYLPSGKICGWDNGAIDDPPMHAGATFVVIDKANMPDKTRSVVNIETFQIRAMTEAEMREFNAPSLVQVLFVRQDELYKTDWRASQPEWAEYRQHLRDITKAGSATDMADAWPLRPDGSDALAQYRKLGQ